MSEQTKISLCRRGHAALIGLITIFTGGVLMLWAWNTIAVELFQAPAVRFKHVVAFQAAVAAVSILRFVIAQGLHRARRNKAA